MRSLLASTAALLIAAAAVDAAVFVLDEQEMARAIALGQRSATADTAFDGEWRVTNAAGEALVVVTPFYRLVLAARHAAFRNDPVTPAERDKLLREQRDRLPMWVSLRGEREDFARHYVPRFVMAAPGGSEQEVVPTFVQNERTALRQDDGFVARCVYGFSTKEVAGSARGALVVRDAGGREVSRFAIDLARMR